MISLSRPLAAICPDTLLIVCLMKSLMRVGTLFTDGEAAWRAFSPDVSATEAFCDFCSQWPYLRNLLMHIQQVATRPQWRLPQPFPEFPPRCFALLQCIGFCLVLPPPATHAGEHAVLDAGRTQAAPETKQDASGHQGRVLPRVPLHDPQCHHLVVLDVYHLCVPFPAAAQLITPELIKQVDSQ